MEIEKLIERLEYIADYEVSLKYCETVHKAAETIKLLWEIAKDTTNAEYKRQIDEWRGEHGND